MNVDNNKNFAELNTELVKTTANTKAINDNIKLQLQQDVNLHRELVKKLDANSQSQNAKLTEEMTDLKTSVNKEFTDLKNALIGSDSGSLASKLETGFDSVSGAISSATSHQTGALTGALEAQTGALTGSIEGSIKGSTDGITTALDAQTGELKGAIDGLQGALNDLADKIPEPCEPTVENNYCENPHGLTSGTTEEIFTQANDAFDASLSSAQSTIESTLLDYSTREMVDKNIFMPYINKVVGFIPSSSQCQPVVAFGHTLDCRPFEIFKQLFGFVLFMLTGMFIIDTILYDFAPNAVGATRRR